MCETIQELLDGYIKAIMDKVKPPQFLFLSDNINDHFM
jgi:hypothetical protein